MSYKIGDIREKKEKTKLFINLLMIFLNIYIVTQSSQ